MLNNLVWDLLDVALYLGVRELPSDETLGGEKGVLWVDDCLSLCCDTDKTFTLLGKSNNRRRCPCTYIERFSYELVDISGLCKPSEFSMILGVLPSITATAEFVVPAKSHQRLRVLQGLTYPSIPKSMPMTDPLTFSSPASAYPLMNEVPKGDLMAGE